METTRSPGALHCNRPRPPDRARPRLRPGNRSRPPFPPLCPGSAPAPIQVLPFHPGSSSGLRPSPALRHAPTRAPPSAQSRPWPSVRVLVYAQATPLARVSRPPPGPDPAPMPAWALGGAARGRCAPCGRGWFAHPLSPRCSAPSVWRQTQTRSLPHAGLVPGKPTARAMVRAEAASQAASSRVPASRGRLVCVPPCPDPQPRRLRLAPRVAPRRADGGFRGSHSPQAPCCLRASFVLFFFFFLNLLLVAVKPV